jgi:uncharacterized small protein (TIGR04563 family)
MGTTLSNHFLDWAIFSKTAITDNKNRLWTLEAERHIGVTYWACENGKDYLFLSYDFEGSGALTGYFTQEGGNEGLPVPETPCYDVYNLSDLTKRYVSVTKNLINTENPFNKNEPLPSTRPSKRRISVYLPEKILNEVKEESLRQDRSVSWLLQKAWALSKDRVQSFPSVGVKVDNDPK